MIGRRILQILLIALMVGAAAAPALAQGRSQGAATAARIDPALQGLTLPKLVTWAGGALVGAAAAAAMAGAGWLPGFELEPLWVGAALGVLVSHYWLITWFDLAPADPVGPAWRRGDQGPAVARLVEALRAAHEYRGPATDYYDGLVEDAVRRFQIRRGLRVDGIAGPETLATLDLGAHNR